MGRSFLFTVVFFICREFVFVDSTPPKLSDRLPPLLLRTSTSADDYFPSKKINTKYLSTISTLQSIDAIREQFEVHSQGWLAIHNFLDRNCGAGIDLSKAQSTAIEIGACGFGTYIQGVSTIHGKVNGLTMYTFDDVECSLWTNKETHQQSPEPTFDFLLGNSIGCQFNDDGTSTAYSYFSSWDEVQAALRETHGYINKFFPTHFGCMMDTVIGSGSYHVLAEIQPVGQCVDSLFWDSNQPHDKGERHPSILTECKRSPFSFFDYFFQKGSSVSNSNGNGSENDSTSSFTVIDFESGQTICGPSVFDAIVKTTIPAGIICDGPTTNNGFGYQTHYCQ